MFWRSGSQVEVLKVGAPDVESKPLAPQGEAQSCFLQAVYPCARGGVYDKLVSQPLLPGSMWAFFYSSKESLKLFLDFFQRKLFRI